MSIFFHIFSAILIISSLCVVLSKNPVYSVLFLVFAFFNAAVIFLLSNAEFLAVTLIIVYVGAVAVLFLFVVMMLNINMAEIQQGFLKYLPFGLLLVGVFVVELSFIFIEWKMDFVEPKINISELFYSGNSNTKSIGLFLYTDYFIIFQMSAYLLLVAMIGAIVLAYSEQVNVRSQDVYKQNVVKKQDVIKLVDVDKKGSKD